MERINVELRQLQSVLAIVETGSFSAAAQKVFLSQPALSLQIKQLEDVLGLRVFDRTTRRVELTPAGAELVELARRVLSETTEALEQLRDYAECRRGRVAIAALPSLASTLLADAVAAFRESLPGVSVVIRDGVASDIIGTLKRGEVDLALGLPMHPEEGLLATPLMKDELVAVSGPGVDLPASRRRIDWKAMGQLPFIAMAPGTSIRQLTDQAFAQFDPMPRPAYEVSFMTTAVALVERGQGITVLPSSALPITLPAPLRRLDVAGPSVVRQVSLLERRGRVRTPATQRMVDHLVAFARTWRVGASAGLLVHGVA